MRIAPSLLAADFANLEKEVRDVETAGIDLLHVDIMDGHFVPNLTMGANVVKALKKVTSAELDVHLMVEEPGDLLRSFIDAGADMISVHAEACRHLHRTVQVIKNAGVKAGVALNPATPAVVLTDILSDLDFILIMTVDPGFGGQSFIRRSLAKIKETHRMIEDRGLTVAIEVDGGINAETLPLCLEAGASLFVAGSAVFGARDRKQAIAQLVAGVG